MQYKYIHTPMTVKCSKKCCIQKCKKESKSLKSKKRCSKKCTRKKSSQQSRANRISTVSFPMPQYIIPEGIPFATPLEESREPLANPRVFSRISIPYKDKEPEESPEEGMSPEKPEESREPLANPRVFSRISIPYQGDKPEEFPLEKYREPLAKPRVFSKISIPYKDEELEESPQEDMSPEKPEESRESLANPRVFSRISIPYQDDEPEESPQEDVNPEEPEVFSRISIPYQHDESEESPHEDVDPEKQEELSDVNPQPEKRKQFTSKQLTDRGCKSDEKTTLVGAVNCPLSATSTKYPFFQDGEKFHSVEQFLLARKASAYGDVEMREAVMRWSGKFQPSNLEEMVSKNMKIRLGRSPTQSRSGTRRWLQTREESLKLANLLKFSAETNNEAAKFLVRTGDRELSLYRTTRPDFEGLDRSLTLARDRLISLLG